MPINDKTSRIVKMFCSTTPERWELQEPFVANGYIYATDTFTAIRVKTDLPDEDNVERKYVPESPPGKKFPLQTLEWAYEKYVVFNYPIKVSQLDTLFESFKKIPVLDYSEQIDCSRCHGDGQLDCPHCHQDYDCPDCQWEGSVGKPRETWELMFDENIYVIVNGTTCVSGSYLIRLREVAKELNQDMVEFQFVDTKDYINPINQLPCYNTAPLFCEVWDALAIIMPLKVEKDPKHHASNVQYVTL